MRRPLLWLGLLVAVAATVPTLVWQADHGWPYARMQQVVTAGFPGVGQFQWDSLTGAGLYIGIPLALFGLVRLLVARDVRPFRFLGAALVVLVLAFLVSSGRAYYVYALYALPLAAGSVGLQRSIGISPSAGRWPRAGIRHCAGIWHCAGWAGCWWRRPAWPG